MGKPFRVGYLRLLYSSKKVGSPPYMISSTLLVLWPPEHWV